MKTAAMFTLMLPLIVSYDPGDQIPDPVTAIGDAVSSASDKITSDLCTGRHLGFDTYAYPGDEAMKAWRQEDGARNWWHGSRHSLGCSRCCSRVSGCTA
jgi:hypothetical protein